MTGRIDASRNVLYRLLPGLLAAALAACATHRPPAAATPTPASPAATEPATRPDTAAERAAVRATAPRVPLQLVYGWTLQDRDARFSGKAAARVQPPYRARLDLFGPRGEGYLTAAMVDSDVRIPEAVRAQADVVPAPTLLWTALGVFRPPEDARLTDVRRSGDQTQLEYARAGERWHFNVVGARVRHAELEDGARRYTVDLRGDGPLGLPKQAVYRDYAAFRELTLTLDQANEAQSFPPEIWSPGGR